VERDKTLIWLRVEAPAKPLAGDQCNGCGVCCASETCPVARVFLWQRRGPCRALLWNEANRHYRCGMLVQASTYLPILPLSWQPAFSRLVVRWIAANTVCDSHADVDVKLEVPTEAHTAPPGKSP
jgi:hypothetical protein